ncbi:NAD(P)/FAD-dependent oxidoreductase [Arthrobacter crystallopoietes]|jgi:thioredoxin reductase|uniref:NAD(P)/FAD-dependent oxidoreductase n=1 Tax=Crystallibacter crystallopoietes TaxID=37928 RepID=UPI001ABDE5B9|nr:NAD(P)/FAD-dependent oxidoreductase [Arthrobacter crystallopoietes]QTG81202.1 NAD(P)/FAD-dependent oxidoreductase [Arthrobacter crystallopoietes]
MTPVQKQEYDVVIIGGGVAGLSAALVLGRARRKVAVVDSGTPRNQLASHAHGFLTRDGTAPAELLRLAREEVRGYGVDLIEATVVDVTEARVAVLRDGSRVSGRHLILATGLRDVLPELAGADERWGRDLLQCPYCHGWEVRDRKLGVLATGDTSFEQALLVRQWSPQVTLFTHISGEPDDVQRRRLAARHVAIVPGEVKGLVVEDDALAALELADGQRVDCQTLFVEPEAAVDSAIISSVGCGRAEDGCITTDGIGKTDIEGVWAVGNANDPSAQLIAAAGDAYRVAVSVNAELVREDVAAAGG